MPTSFVSPKLVAVAETDPGLVLDAAVRDLEACLLQFESWNEAHRREQDELRRRIWSDMDVAGIVGA